MVGDERLEISNGSRYLLNLLMFFAPYYCLVY